MSGMINPAWIQRYNEQPNPTNIIQSWDLGRKSVCTIWQSNKKQHSIVSMAYCNESMEVDKHIIEVAGNWIPSAILIEECAQGNKVLQELRLTTSLPLIATRPRNSSIERFARIVPYFETGQIYLPKKAPWLADYECELFNFPEGRGDKMASTTSQYLNWIKDKETAPMRIRRF